LRQPQEVCFSEVHESIRDASNPFLSDIFGFRLEAIKELAEKEGIDLEALNLLKRHNVSAEQLRQLLGESGEPTDSMIEDEESERDNGSADSDSENGGVQEQGNSYGESAASDGSQTGKTNSATGNSGGGSGRKSQGGSRSQFYTYVGTNTNLQPDDDEKLPQDERRQIEAAAIAYIVEVEPTLQKTPPNHPGFDLFEGEALEFPVRFVEVKSKKGPWSGLVALSDEQFHLADSERERYWLYVVEFAEQPNKRRVHRIQDPAGKARHFTYDSGWKALAETDNTN
jgi:hypothetical protein